VTTTDIPFDTLLAGEITGAGTVSVADGIVQSVVAGAGGAGQIVLPALCNAHDHGRGLRTVAFGAGDDALELWIPKLGLEPLVDPYLRALVAFGRTAEGGVGIINHCHNTQTPDALMTEAEAVARAAADVGIRVAFATPLMGYNPITYGDPAPFLNALPPAIRDTVQGRGAGLASFADQLALAEDIFALQSPHFHPQYGPVGPQWVDDATLAAVAERSALHNRRVHMHLLETKAQREWADATYPGGIVRHLDTLGLLSPRITFAHGTWLRPDEVALLAERGAMVSVNTSSNLRLRSGIAPVADFVAGGLGFGMGLDGMAFDDDEDALREVRMLWHLQRGFGLTRVMEQDRLWQAVVTDGRRAILGTDGGGRVSPGAPADLLAVRTDRIMADVLPDRADAADLMLVRAVKADIAGLWIGGRQVVRDGVCQTIDLPAAAAQLLDQARKHAGPIDHDMLAIIEASYRAYYASGCHCHPAGAT
jgi:cytosine/adenosine deaminase-related metal-dependent hydrolase